MPCGEARPPVRWRWIEVQKEIDCENDRLKDESQEEYTRTTGAELQTRCRELTKETADRYETDACRDNY